MCAHRDKHAGQLTSSGSSSILEPVLRFRRRLSAAVLAMVIATANGAVCAGWMPTPEARMACCSEGGACPMHKGESHSSGSERVLTQAQADSCCASSERENSSQSKPHVCPRHHSAVLGVGIVLPASVPALVLSDGWRRPRRYPSRPFPSTFSSPSSSFSHSQSSCVCSDSTSGRVGSRVYARGMTSVVAPAFAH